MREAAHSSWSVRRAHAGDLQAITELQKVTHRPPRSDSPISEYLIAESDRKIIGCAAVRMRDSAGYLYGLTVEKMCRRRGVGHALTQRRIEWLRDESALVAYVLAMFWNIKFFKKHGFVLKNKSNARELEHLHRDFTESWCNRSALLALELSSLWQAESILGRSE
jgi:N-acetylglutamate synthase-like GNAT family acetyltransferase